MSNITIRPMEPEDWNAVSEIYSEGIATEHATFQTTCPPYTAWDAFHIKECRLVILDGGELADLLIVSRVEVTVGGELSVSVSEAAGAKCPRCWKHSTKADENGLCPRCAAIVAKLPEF